MALNEVLADDFNFELMSEYLRSNSRTTSAISRILTLILNRYTFDLKDIMIVIETPNGEQKIDFLRLSTQHIHLARSTFTESAGTETDIRASAPSSHLITKVLSLSGSTRLEVFSLPKSDLSTSMHASSIGANLMPALFDLDETLKITAEYSMLKDLKIKLQTKIQTLSAGLHFSQLPLVVNVLNAYKRTIERAQSYHPSLAPKGSKSNSSPSPHSKGPHSRTTSQAKISVSRFSDSTFTSRPEDDGDLESSKLQPSVSAPPSSSGQPSEAPSTLTHFQIEVEHVNFAYIPEGPSSGEESPFRTTAHINAPATTSKSFIQSSLTKIFISSDPAAQTVSVGEVSLSDCAFILEDSWHLLPEITRSYVPRSGYYNHKTLSILPASLEVSSALSISLGSAGGLSMALGALEVYLPLSLPKLFSAALTDLTRALSVEVKVPQVSSVSIAHSLAEDALFAEKRNRDIRKQITGQNAAQQLLQDGLALGEAMIFETGSYTSISLTLHSASIVFEIPEPADIRYDEVSVLRPERLRLTLNDISAELSFFHDPFSHEDDSVPGDGQRASNAPSSHSSSLHLPYRTLSARFWDAAVTIERHWHLFNPLKMETTLIGTLEGQSARLEDPRLENIRLEWRDYGQDLVGKYLQNDLPDDPLDGKPSSKPSDYDLKSASRDNLEKIGISPLFADRVPFSTNYRSSARLNHAEAGEKRKEGLSETDLSQLASTPSDLSIAVTVHMTQAHVSNVIYSLLMDTYDAYVQASTPVGGPIFKTVRSHYGPSSPFLVNFRSHHAEAFLYTDQEPYSIESRQPEKGPPARAMSISADVLHILQTSRFLQTDRSLFYATTKIASALDESLNPLFESKKLNFDGEIASLPNAVTFIYANRPLLRDVVSGITRSETDMVADLKDSVITWGFDDKWPWRIMTLFQRLPSPHRLAFTQAEGHDAGAEPNPYNLMVNLRGTSVALWGAIADSSPLFSSSSDPNEPINGGASRPGDSPRSDFPNESPRLLANPQLVLVPHSLHLKIDMNRWLLNASWDKVDLFSAIDRLATASLAERSVRPTSQKEFWLQRKHLPAGALETGLLRYDIPASHFTLEYGLHLITTPSQLVTLQFLYNAYSEAWMKPKEPLRDEGNDANPLERSAEFEERILPPQPPPEFPWGRIPPNEPIARVDKEGIGSSLVSDEWSPKPSTAASIRMAFYMKPADIVWSLKHENAEDEESQTDESKFQTLDLNFYGFDLQYLVDKNECALLELSIKEISGISMLNGERTWTFLDFDQQDGQSRMMPWYFSRRTDNKGFESTSPLSTRFGRPHIAHSTSNERPSFLHGQGNASSSAPSSDSSNSSSHSGSFDTPHKLDSLRIEMQPVHLLINPSRARFLHSFYRSYHSGAVIYDLVVPEVELDETSGPGSHPDSHVRPRVTGPYFKFVNVGNVHLRLSIPTMNDTELRFPQLFLTNVIGWSALSLEIWRVYEPSTRNLLPRLVKALPGLRLVSTLVYGLSRLVIVPIDELTHGRSATKGFFTALGSGLSSTVVEATSLGGTALSFFSRPLMGFSWLLTRASRAVSSTSEEGEEGSGDRSEAIHEDWEYSDSPEPCAEDLNGALVEARKKLGGGVTELATRLSTRATRLARGNSRLGDVLGAALSLPNLIFLPAYGAVAGAGMLFHGASSQMRARPVNERPLLTEHASKPHAADLEDSMATEEENEEDDEKERDTEA